MEELKRYFIELLQQSITKDKLLISSQTFDYLSSLLVNMSRVNDADNDILTFCYRDAAQLKGHARFKAFKHLGDTSLFTSSFFSKYIESRGSLKYYVDMGVLGYNQASLAFGYHPVMDELQKKFVPIIAVMHDISIMTNINKELTVEQLFELYSIQQADGIFLKLSKKMATPVARSGLA